MLMIESKGEKGQESHSVSAIATNVRLSPMHMGGCVVQW